MTTIAECFEQARHDVSDESVFSRDQKSHLTVMLDMIERAVMTAWQTVWIPPLTEDQRAYIEVEDRRSNAR